MRGALAIAKLNVEWTDVRSPIDGLAGIAQTRVGTLVNPNQRAHRRLDARSDPRVGQHQRARIPDSYAERLNHVNEPRYANTRFFELILIDGHVHPYQVRRVIVNRQIDPSTGTLLVQALFPNPGNILRPGLFAKVRVHSGAQIDDARWCRSARCRSCKGATRSASSTADGRVQMRTVKLGRQIDHSYVVENGLHDGRARHRRGAAERAAGREGERRSRRSRRRRRQAAAEPQPPRGP